jgi:hypothetical protein
VEPAGTHGRRYALWRWEGLCDREGEGEGEGGGGKRYSLGLAGEDEQTKGKQQHMQDHDVCGGLHGGGDDDGVVVVLVPAVLLLGRGS